MSHRKPGSRQVQAPSGNKYGLAGHTLPSTSFAFNGSNASNSGDSGTGSHTYHIPNYATSYASENTHLITVSLGNDQGEGVKKVFIAFIVICCVILQAYCYVQYAPKIVEITNVGSLLPKLSSRETVHPVEENISCGKSYTCQDSEVIKIRGNWGEIRRGERCLGFSTREYSAHLLDLPLLANWRDICESMPIEIHGRIYDKPERCERQKIFGPVIAYWLVKSEETDCATSWNKFSDEGCVQKRPGYRLVSSRISNIKGEDTNLMCRTTPAMINGIQYDKPAYCVKGYTGAYGNRVMNRIFGTSTSRKPKPTLQDAISATDNRVASIEVKVKKLDGELARYKEQMAKLRGGPGKDAIQQRALRTLKQKRMYESQLAQLNQQVFNMESAALTTENMRNTMATFDAMQQANKEMKKQYGKFDIDKIEQMHYDMEDMLEQANEIQESLARSYAVPDEIDEADLEAELDALALEEEEEGTSYLADLNKVPDFVDEPPVEVNEPSRQEAVKTGV